MTYLDLVASSLFQGLVLVWPFSGDLLTARLFPWSTDPTLAPLLQAVTATGALMALLLLLHRDLAQIGHNAWAAVKRRQDGSTRLLFALCLGAAPLAVIGTAHLHLLTLPAWGGIILVMGSGLALLVADHLGVTVRDMDHVSILNYAIIGLLMAGSAVMGLAPQITAIITARLMGCERDQAVRIALLLLLPYLICQFGAYLEVPVLPPLAETLIMVGLSALAGLLAGSVLLGWLHRHTLRAPAVLQVITAALIILSVARFGG